MEDSRERQFSFEITITNSWPVLVLIISAAIAVLARTRADADLWGHLRFGLDFIESGKISYSDPYSYLSQDQVWINHEWLAEVITAIFWKVGGIPGLILFKLVISMVTFILILYHMLNQGLTPVRAGILIFLGMMLIYPAFGTIRPHIFTVLFFTCVILLIFYPRKMWLSPAWFALWANLHGGFLAGLGVVGIWALIRRDRDSILILGKSILATFLNPYGPKLLLFLLKTATVPRPEISEWWPINLSSSLGFSYLALLFVTFLGVQKSKLHKNRIHIILLLLLGIMPILAVRHVPLFASGTLILAAPHLSNIWNRWRQPSLSSSSFSWISGVGSLAMLLLAFPRFISLPFMETLQLPCNAVTLLKKSGVSWNMAIHFDWGEYAIWHLSDRIKVSVDGRRETVYPEKSYMQNLEFIIGCGNWNALLNEGTDLVLINQGSAADNLMSLSPDWLLIFEDDVSTLYAHIDYEELTTLQDTVTNYKFSIKQANFP